MVRPHCCCSPPHTPHNPRAPATVCAITAVIMSLSIPRLRGVTRLLISYALAGRRVGGWVGGRAGVCVYLCRGEGCVRMNGSASGRPRPSLSTPTPPLSLTQSSTCWRG